MNIEGKCVVTFHYTLKNDEGEQLDSSSGRDPLTYLHGASNIVPGLERALEGKKTGDDVQAVVNPEEGYGDVKEDLVQNVPLSAFSGVPEVKPGMQFQAQGPDGNVQLITIKEVGEEEVTVDGNHPLAGQTLHFDISVQEVREPTEEELEHGHAH